MSARSQALKDEAAAMHAVEQALNRAGQLEQGAGGRVLRYAAELVSQRLAEHTTGNGQAPVGDQIGTGEGF